jgi:zinc protease
VSAAALPSALRAALVVALFPLTACGPDARPRPLTGIVSPVRDTLVRPKDTALPRESPPPSGPRSAFHLPRPAWATLPSGLTVGTVEAHATPLCEVQVLVRGGRAAEGDRVGVASLLAALLQKEAATRVEALGAELRIDVDADAITLRLATTSDALGPALSVLSSVVSSPELRAADFRDVKRRLVGEIRDSLKEDGDAIAELVLWRGLFTAPSGRHPYGSISPTPGELDRLGLEDCKAFAARLFVPKNTIVLAAGDVTKDAVEAAATKAFSRYRGAEPPSLALSPTVSAAGRRVLVAHLKGADRSEIRFGRLGPRPADADMTAFQVVNVVLGNKGTGRLFMDVREKRSLVYSLRSQVAELALGPSALVIETSTQTPKTEATVEAILEHLARLAGEAPGADEVSVAQRFLADVFATRMGTVHDVVTEIARLRLLGLPDDDHDARARALDAMTAKRAAEVARRYFGAGPEVIAVAGDADVIAEKLRRFGEVTVLDPEKDLAVQRRLTAGSHP